MAAGCLTYQQDWSTAFAVYDSGSLHSHSTCMWHEKLHAKLDSGASVHYASLLVGSVLCTTEANQSCQVLQNLELVSSSCRHVTSVHTAAGPDGEAQQPSRPA